MKRATRVVDDLPAVPAQASAAPVQVVEVQVSGERSETVEDGPGLRLTAAPSEPASLKLQISGLTDPSTVIAVATTRVDADGAPLARLILEGGGTADEPPADEMVGTGEWTRLAVAAEDGHWQDGAAMISLQVGRGGTRAQLDVSEIRIVVDGQTALVLPGQQLAALAH